MLVMDFGAMPRPGTPSLIAAGGTMTLRWVVASLHLLALGIGLGAIVVRARALRAPFDPARLPTVFLADGLWGGAALLWICTGLWRAFGGLEKGTGYYLHHPAFHAKMALLGAIFLLELWPMVTLVRWRIARAGGRPWDPGAAAAMARISAAQAVLVVAMVFAATAMARGLGL
jgi:putative membrane protein